MKATYYPFTYIFPPILQNLQTCFNRIISYQPSSLSIPSELQGHCEDGFIDFRIPIVEDSEKVEKIVGEYRVWAENHQGSELSFFKLLKDKSPFYDVQSSRNIRDEIKKSVLNQKTETKESDPVLEARIFLKIAHDFDMNQWALNQDIMASEELEDTLLKSIHGEDELQEDFPTGMKMTEFDDPGAYMTAERFGAWLQLWLNDPQKENLWITSSRLVFEYLIEMMNESEKICEYDLIPANPEKTDGFVKWRTSILKRLENALNEAAIDTSPLAVDIPHDPEAVGYNRWIFYRTPVERILERWIPKKQTSLYQKDFVEKNHYIVFGLITPNAA